jgi:hypothetical protein
MQRPPIPPPPAFVLKHNQYNWQGDVVHKTKAEKIIFELYKKRTRKELTLGEIREATRNIVRFIRLFEQKPIGSPTGFEPRDPLINNKLDKS